MLTTTMNVLVEITANLPGGHRQQLLLSRPPIYSQSLPLAYGFRLLFEKWIFVLIYHQMKSNTPPSLVGQQAILALPVMAAGSVTCVEHLDG